MCRACLLAVSLLAARSTLAQSQSDSSASITWSSPSAGDVYGPGDTIIGKWQAAQKTVSPSFRLCTGGTGGCGATVWPEVSESAGSYVISMMVPNVTAESGYYLSMKDDFGQTASSPIFNLSPSGASSSSPQSPNGAQSDPFASASNALPAPTNTHTPNTNTNTNGTAPLLSASSTSGPPAVALAVPLSLAGAVLLCAGALGVHHRRRLAAERAEDARIVAASSSASLSSSAYPGGESENKQVLNALSRHASLLSLHAAPAPAPAPAPMQSNADLEKALLIHALVASTSRREPRTRTRAPFIPAPTPSVYAPSPAPSAALARQRRAEAALDDDEYAHEDHFDRVDLDTPSVTSDVLGGYVHGGSLRAGHDGSLRAGHDSSLRLAHDGSLRLAHDSSLGLGHTPSGSLGLGHIPSPPPALTIPPALRVPATAPLPGRGVFQFAGARGSVSGVYDAVARALGGGGGGAGRR